ncbi:MAG: type II toxin-antitoxin system VapC family toxin [Halioglobus sp.]
MILVDTSVWVEFFRHGSEELQQLLDSGQAVMHPFVLGELACGYLDPRAEILGDLRELPCAVLASDDEVLYFIEQHQLMGAGIGYLDAHLLASSKLSEGLGLWTYDKKLARAANELSSIH